MKRPLVSKATTTLLFIFASRAPGNNSNILRHLSSSSSSSSSGSGISCCCHALSIGVGGRRQPLATTVEKQPLHMMMMMNSVANSGNDYSDGDGDNGDSSELLFVQASKYTSLTRKTREASFRLNLSDYHNSIKSQYLLAMECGYDSYQDLDNDLSVSQQAREVIMTKHIKLVYSIAHQIANRRSLNSLTKEDLIQEGVIGLSRAIEKFDVTQQVRFSTYASYWIRAAMLRGIAEKDYFIRVPEGFRGTFRKLNAAASAIGFDLDTILKSQRWKEAEKAKELAERAGMSLKQVEDVFLTYKKQHNATSGGGYVPLQVYHDSQSSNKYGVIGSQPPPQQTSLLNNNNNSNNQEAVNQRLSKYLQPKEIQVLGLRYGLNEETKTYFRNYEAEAEEYLFGSIITSTDPLYTRRTVATTPGKKGEAMSFKEVGLRIGVSAEYCRRICASALKKLRKAAEDGDLVEAELQYLF